VPSGATHRLSASYAGSSDYTGSSDSTARNDPSISAHVTSARSKSRYGWYRTPVTVSFTCAANGADLAAPCPTPVTLSHNAAGQAVTRTVTATDGGSATAIVSGINIDRAAPRPSIGGVRDGATYRGAAPTPRCVGHDGLSGTATCKLSLTRSGDLVRYRVTASDLAGNTASARGSYHVLSAYLQGAALDSGSFVVHAGRTYTLVFTTAGRTAPRYFYAAVSGRKPGPAGPLMHPAGSGHGRHVWTIPVRIDSRMTKHTSWVLGVQTNGSLRRVHIHVER
jgi:hypothetical protein